MMKIKEIEKIIVSEIANGYEFDEIWELDAIDYLKTNNKFNYNKIFTQDNKIDLCRLPRSPPRSPLRYEKINNITIKNSKYFNINEKLKNSKYFNINEKLKYLKKYNKLYWKIVYLYLIIVIFFIFLLFIKQLLY